MLEEIICAGFGGQGIIFMGKLLAWAALECDKFVTYIPSYGAEMRGGTANCSVIISDNEIPSPLIEKPTGLIVMNRNSLDKFEKRLKKGGLLVINSSLAGRRASREDTEVLYVPATEIAEEVGDVRVANIVAIGAYVGRGEVLPIEKIEQSLYHLLPKGDRELLEKNVRALKRGEEIGKKL
ncbi:MAG TPA: 2-oxoacid:ferredoxin oxidoreductase subunit gamma [Candidatus Omnitrophica bacterium]|nr:2-oxoacid:ferredoxin oxidoreductase subunit gamma [Candidatus Omnitrophota bacterium]